MCMCCNACSRKPHPTRTMIKHHGQPRGTAKAHPKTARNGRLPRWLQLRCARLLTCTDGNVVASASRATVDTWTCLIVSLSLFSVPSYNPKNGIAGESRCKNSQILIWSPFRSTGELRHQTNELGRQRDRPDHPLKTPFGIKPTFYGALILRTHLLP